MHISFHFISFEPSLTLPGLAPTPGRISGPSERREASLGGDRPAGGPEKEAAQRQGSLSLQPPPIAIRIRHSRFLDVARSRSDARPDFRSGRAKRASWEAIPRRGVPGRRPRNVKEGTSTCRKWGPFQGPPRTPIVSPGGFRFSLQGGQILKDRELAVQSHLPCIG